MLLTGKSGGLIIRTDSDAGKCQFALVQEQTALRPMFLPVVMSPEVWNTLMLSL